MSEHADMQISDGQIIFSPSRTPYEVLPGFIKAWAVTDLVFAGIWCLVALLLLVLCGLLLATGADCCALELPGSALIPAVLSGVLGLIANIQLLSRKPAAMRAAKLLIALTLVRLLGCAAIGVMTAATADELPLQVTIGIVTVAAVLARTTLLVFYWIAVARAARYFAGRRRMLGF